MPKKKKKAPFCHFTFVSLSILFIHTMLFLKNRKGTKREMQTYRVRAWYLEGPVAQDQNGWDRGNKTMGTGDRFSTALSSSIPA